MFKKFLILPIIGLFGLTAFASASFEGDGNITPFNCSVVSDTRIDISGVSPDNYVCVELLSSNSFSSNSEHFNSYNDNKVFCSNKTLMMFQDNNYFYFNDPVSLSSCVYSNKVMSWVADPETPDEGGLLPGSSDGSFGGGITNGVNSMLSGFGNVIPDLLLYGLPLLIVFLFWKWIRSYIKHFFVGGKLPDGDHITNCDLYARNNGDFVHKYSDWKNSFIEKHSVLVNDSFIEFEKKAESYADEKLRSDPDFYRLSSEKSMERWGKYKMDYMKRFGNY